MPKFRRTILVNIMSACLIINLSCYNERLIKFFTKYYSEKFSDIFFTVPWCENVKNIPSNLINDYYSYYQWYGNAAVALNKINTDNFSIDADAKIEYQIAKLFGINETDYGIIYKAINEVQQMIPFKRLLKVSVKDIFNNGI